MADKNVSDKIHFEDGLNKAGFGLYSYLLTFISGFAIISFMLVVYPSNVIVPSSACELNTTSGQQGIIAAAPVVGSIVGNLLWGYLADTKGRRKMLLVALLVSASLNVVTSFSVNWIMLLVLQLIISIFASGVFPMSMSLLSESVPMANRNFSVLVVMSMYFLSQSFVAGLAIPIAPLTFSYYLPALGIYWNAWRTLLLIYSLPCLISALFFYLMYESPKYLFVNGEEDRAIGVLQNIHKINNLRSKEIFEMKGFLRVGSEFDKVRLSTKEQFLPLFKPPLLKNTVTIIALLMFQQLGPFMMWLPTIANQFIQSIEAGESMDQTVCQAINAQLDAPDDPDSSSCVLQTTALVITVCVGVVHSVANAFVSLIVDIFGRRNLIIVICAVCGTCGILVNLVPNAIGSAVLFMVFLMGAVVLGLFTTIVVAIYPTHLRYIDQTKRFASSFIMRRPNITDIALLKEIGKPAEPGKPSKPGKAPKPGKPSSHRPSYSPSFLSIMMNGTFAMAVPLACSTMADFASIQIMNLLLTQNCEAGFYLFASLFTSMSIVALLLPDERYLLAKHQ